MTHQKKRNRRYSAARALWWPTAIALSALVALSSMTARGSPKHAERDPTDVLRKEHQIIGKIVGVAEQEAQHIRSSNTVDRDRIAKLHDFFTHFADECHHAKEERELFPLLRQIDVDATVIDALIAQHEEGRVWLAGIESRLSLPGKLPAKEREALAEYLSQYASLMERHIPLENHFLWPRATKQLDREQKDRLAEAFQRIELQELGEGFHEKYHALAMELLGK